MTAQPAPPAAAAAAPAAQSNGSASAAAGDAGAAMVERRAFVVSSDKIRQFFDDYLGGLVRDPLDPRESGMQGAYPSLFARSPHRLPRLLYSRVGLFRTIVDMPADDIWSKGYEPVTDDPTIGDEVRRLERRLQLRQKFRLATRMARRDGRALVYYRLRDNTGDPALPPTGVRSIVRVEVLPTDAIERVELDEDANSDTVGEPLYYWLRQASRDDQYARTSDPYSGGYTYVPAAHSVRVHRDRVQLVIQHPKEGREWEGDSVLGWVLGDAQGHENVKWAAATGYVSRNVPPLVVTIDKELNLDPENPEDKKHLEDLDDKVNKLVSGAAQKIRIGGATITPLLGAERINPPDVYAKMFVQDISAGSRIPQREITGDAAGTLAAAGWDQKRYFGRIEGDRQDFGTPLVEGAWDRFDRWGLLPGLMARVKDVHWYPNLEMSEKERADVLDVTARAVSTFRTARVPIPDEVTKLVTWPEGFDHTEIPEPPPTPAPFGSPSPLFSDNPPEGDALRGARALTREARRARAHRNLRIEATPQLRRIEDRLERALLDAFRAWRGLVDDAIAQAQDEPTGGALNAIRRTARGRRDTNQRARELEATILRISFESEVLQRAIREALEEAGELGLLQTWQRIGRERVREFLETPRALVIQQFARAFAEDKARRLSDALRDIVADVLLRGGGVQDITVALRERFGVLENEAAIARTEAMRGYNNGSLAAMQDAGVREWEFSVYHNACQTCAPLDGQRYPIWDTARLPPNGTHPNCRCIPVEVLPEPTA